MEAPDLLIRIADPERDYGRYVELRNQSANEPDTVARMRQLEADLTARDFCRRFVVEAEDVIVAAGSVLRLIWQRTGTYRIAAYVDERFRRRGIGSVLLKHLEDAALAEAALALEVFTSDRDTTGLSFLEHRGYELEARSFESVLDLRSFALEINLKERFPNLTFFTYGETTMGLEEQRKLWDLNVQTLRDEPHSDPDHVPEFDRFVESVIQASWFDPAGQFIAADGENWVGMSAVGSIRDGSCYNLYTGVRRSYRGLGLAKALKILSTQHAKSLGYSTIRTNNDSRNAAMLAVNRSLGYRAEPGSYMTLKVVSRRDEGTDHRDREVKSVG